MGRLVMDRGMRRIKRAPAAEPDQRLLLVEQFAAARQPDPADDPMVQKILEFMGQPLDQGSQEPAEQPVADETENSSVEVSEAADEEPAKPEPVVEASPRLDADDYDPIAAVLG